MCMYVKQIYMLEMTMPKHVSFRFIQQELLSLVTTDRYDTMSGEGVRYRYIGCSVGSMILRAFV